MRYIIKDQLSGNVGSTDRFLVAHAAASNLLRSWGIPEPYSGRVFYARQCNHEPDDKEMNEATHVTDLNLFGFTRYTL